MTVFGNYPGCFLFVLQRVTEHLPCLKSKVSKDYEMMMRLLFRLMIPSSQLQRSVQFSVIALTVHLIVPPYHTLFLSIACFAQLFQAMSLEDVYQPLKPAALYEEALCLVRENKVQYRSLR